MKTARFIFGFCCFLSAHGIQPPIFEGTQCIESNVVFDVEVTPFEFTWKLNNFKGYYEISKKFRRLVKLSQKIQFPRNQQRYSAEIDFMIHLQRSSLSSDKTFEIGVRVNLAEGSKKADLKSLEYEFEGEVILRSTGYDRKSVTTGSNVGKKNEYFGYIEFDVLTGFKMDTYKFEEILGINTTQNYPVELSFLLQQYKMPATIGTNDIQTTCGARRFPQLK